MPKSEHFKINSTTTPQNKSGLKFSLSIALIYLLSNSILLSNSTPFAHAADTDYMVRQYNIKGNIALSKKSFQEAIDYYQEALKLDPSNAIMKRNIAVAHNNWALYLASRQQKEEAIEHWKQCLKVDPGFTSARNNLKVMQMTLSNGPGGTPNAYEPWEPDPSELEKANKAIEEKSAANDAKDTNSKSTDTTGTNKSVDNSKAVILNSSQEEENKNPFRATNQGPKTDSYTNKDIFTTEPKPSSNQPAESVNQTNASVNQATESASQPTKVEQSPPSNVTASVGNTIGDRLDKLEAKVYGQNNKQATFIQRLEKLEKDILGSSKTSGSILERIKTLETNLGG